MKNEELKMKNEETKFGGRRESQLRVVCLILNSKL